MGIKLKNNAFATIPAALSTTDTTLIVSDGQGSRFPSLGTGDYFYGTILDVRGNFEIVKVTARFDDTMTIVRAQEGTVPLSFPTNSRIELRITVATLEEFLTDRGAILLE